MLKFDIKENFVKVCRVVRMYYRLDPNDPVFPILRKDYETIGELVIKIKDNELFFLLFGATIGILSKHSDDKTDYNLYILIINVVSLIDDMTHDDIVSYVKTFTNLTSDGSLFWFFYLKEAIDRLKELNEEIYNNPEYKYIL